MKNTIGARTKTNTTAKTGNRDPPPPLFLCTPKLDPPLLIPIFDPNHIYPPTITCHKNYIISLYLYIINQENP
ncbi:hypothetical protein HanXRQr2_Chr16g0765311 [Helianthus annuus]|uniref:Uncharacterized protein n=1 Tax=Helianthus annuus TaxID=4232 RepID=A0A9K3H008_HELAN|nr:hypothetical protein HanXRQr2_Chr16g0765311 [Helianthus annuus]KAJ0822559.1 hypothetical protein HanPSC8_Chr16g0733481 [Helianthus annuus]